MLTTSRKSLLLDRLQRDGQLLVGPLATELGLSEDTLRRDLRELAALGKLVRVHGGAVAASATHIPVAARLDLNDAEKQHLARAASTLILDNMVVIVDGGTTHLHLAAALPTSRQCTIVTHSPAIAASFEHHDRVEIVLIGGKIFRHSMVAMGPDTARSFSGMRADLCLLGVTGLHPDLGLTTGDSDEAALKNIMMAAAAETAVLATQDKLNRAHPWRIAELSQIATLITETARPDWLPKGTAHLRA